MENDTYNTQNSKKTMPGFIIMAITALIAFIFADIESVFVYGLNSIIYSIDGAVSEIFNNIATAFSNIASIVITVAILSFGGYLYKKSFKGSIMFLGCYCFGADISYVVRSLIGGVAYTRFGDIHGAPYIVMIASSVVITALVSSLLIFFADKAEKKAALLPEPAPLYDAYGNPMPLIKKKGFTVKKVAIFGAATALCDIVCSFIYTTIWDMLEGPEYDYATALAASQFASVITASVCVIVFILCALLIGKKVPDILKLAGCLALGGYLSSVIKAALSVISNSLITVISVENYSLLNMVFSLVATILTVVFGVVIALVLSKRKDFTEE